MIKDVTARRIQEGNQDFLILLDQDNNLVAKSNGSPFDLPAYLNYEGFTFMALPSAKISGENNIFISFQSIKDVMKNKK